MPSPPPHPPNEIYQFSLLSALMSGVASSGIPASSLSSYTQGLGTFASIDGELILLDGVVYQLKSDGSVHVASPEDEIPFVMATNLRPTDVFRMEVERKDAVHGRLGEVFGGCGNLFVAYRVHAVDGKGFGRVKVRTVGGQRYKGQPLGELGDGQKVFEYEDVDGVVVGFRSPMNWQGISLAGEHMHFLSADRKFGGHVLELEAEEVEVRAAVVSSLHIDLPRSREFNEADLRVDDGGIRKVEG